MDAKPLPGNLEVRVEDNAVILEPGPVHGVRGFTLYLTRSEATSLGHRLISAAVGLLPPTTSNKERSNG